VKTKAERVKDSWAALAKFHDDQFRGLAGRQRTPPRFENSHYLEFPCIRYLRDPNKVVTTQVIHTEDDPIPEGHTEITDKDNPDSYTGRIFAMRKRSEQEYLDFWYGNNDNYYKDQETGRLGGLATSAYFYSAMSN
jgi:hypothetical protein